MMRRPLANEEAGLSTVRGIAARFGALWVVGALLFGCGSNSDTARGSDQLRADVNELAEDGPAPPEVVVPLDLPQGWKYQSAGGSWAQSWATATLDFFKPDGPPRGADGALPAVTICVSLSSEATNCQASITGLSAKRLDSGDGPPAYILGPPAALSDWEGTAWTTDLEQVGW
jgi:hypothetical protein